MSKNKKNEKKYQKLKPQIICKSNKYQVKMPGRGRPKKANAPKETCKNDKHDLFESGDSEDTDIPGGVKRFARQSFSEDWFSEIKILAKNSLRLEEKIENLFEKYFKKLDCKLEKMNEIEEKVNTNNAKIDEHETRLRRMEYETIKQNIIIKGLKLSEKAQNGYETKDQTEENVKKILKLLKIEKQIDVLSALRFKNTGGKPGQIQVKLGSMKEKMTIFQALKKIKPKNITVRDEFSRSLKENALNLEKEAYQIRQVDNATKTRVIMIDGGAEAILLIKRKSDQKFTRWEKEGGVFF